MKIVVDMMGSDLGSVATVSGVIAFHKRHPEVELICVGKQEELNEIAAFATIIDARDVVPMTAGAMDVLRAKQSSLLLAINAVLDQKADAIVGAGSTGGFLSAATLKLKLLPGVERAAIVAPFPTKIKGKKVVVLDIGANNENTPDQIVQFALMGRLYSKSVFNVEQPKVFLLSNGAEDDKGSPEIKAAHKMLREQNFPGFVGNVEAREALDGNADVLVTGGFAGNIFLKSAEGVAKMMGGMIKKAFTRSLIAKIGYLFTRKGIKEMNETFDYKSTGGAMLLGINSVVVKAHGNSDGYSFSSALEVAYKMVESDIIAKMKEGFVHE